MALDKATTVQPHYREWRAATAVIPHEAHCPTVYNASSECSCITGDAIWAVLGVGWLPPRRHRLTVARPGPDTPEGTP